MKVADILECPYCGKQSNWVDYVGNQYKSACPFCQRILKDRRKSEESDAKEDSSKE